MRGVDAAARQAKGGRHGQREPRQLPADLLSASTHRRAPGLEPRGPDHISPMWTMGQNGYGARQAWRLLRSRWRGCREMVPTLEPLIAFLNMVAPPGAMQRNIVRKKAGPARTQQPNVYLEPKWLRCRRGLRFIVMCLPHDSLAILTNQIPRRGSVRRRCCPSAPERAAAAPRSAWRGAAFCLEVYLEAKRLRCRRSNYRTELFSCA